MSLNLWENQNICLFTLLNDKTYYIIKTIIYYLDVFYQKIVIL